MVVGLEQKEYSLLIFFMVINCGKGTKKKKSSFPVGQWYSSTEGLGQTWERDCGERSLHCLCCELRPVDRCDVHPVWIWTLKSTKGGCQG